MGKRQPVVEETPTTEATATSQVKTNELATQGAAATEAATATLTREPGDDTPQERKHAPDPFVFAADYEAGIRLRESRRFRRSEIEFLEGKPSQPVLDQLKSDGFRWSPDEQVWTRPVGVKDAYATRVEAERTYKQVVSMIREEKGISRNPF
jgi:hypothetical protein